MFYVYFIRSLESSNQVYIGITRNLKKRLIKHNSGCSYHTAKYKPWELEFFLGFKHKTTAVEFEKYLKSHSGRAFTIKRLLKNK